ncbi:MAG: T9SS type A sorting domain-containing protein [Bacteroidia bacterium]|nr:T9SS type A sorting domain-containing protein [Bacteroidia bacterium]
MKKNYLKLRTKITILIFLSLSIAKIQAQTGILTGWGMSICNQYSFSICPGEAITPYDYGSQTYVCNMTVMPDVSFVNQGPVWRVAKHNWNFVATGANALITGVDPSGNTISWPFMAGAVLAPSAYTNSNSVNYVTFSINNSPIAFTVNENNFQIQLSGTNTPISANSATICQGQSATLTASGASNYTWNPGNSNGASFLANPSTSTIYTVTGNNGNCSYNSSKIVTVTVNNNPTLAISGSTIICRGNTVTLTASGASTYSWSSGAAVPGVTLAPLLTATYSVTGTLANGCSNNAVITVSVSACTGIDALSDQNQITIFPNPFKNTVVIESAFPCQLIIVDETGKTVYTDKNLSEGTNSINLSELCNGVYFVKIIATEGNKTYKLIKNN